MISKTPEVVIADTSCLIVLYNAGLLHLLESIYNTVTITPEIAREYTIELPNWIRVSPVKDLKFFSHLNSLVDDGEASAIALAMELEVDCLLILDDHKVRRVANDLELKYTGTLGVLANARKQGIITELKPIIDSIILKGFRVDPKLRAHILNSVGEKP